MSPQLASAKSSILDSVEADAARAKLRQWLKAFYANLDLYPGECRIDTTSEHEPDDMNEPVTPEAGMRR